MEAVRSGGPRMCDVLVTTASRGRQGLAKGLRMEARAIRSPKTEDEKPLGIWLLSWGKPSVRRLHRHSNPNPLQTVAILVHHLNERNQKAILWRRPSSVY
jgi:hypothetical protein